MTSSFLVELLQSISERGRFLLDFAGDRRIDGAKGSADLIVLCNELLSVRGEASGVALAREILDCYQELTLGQRTSFFQSLATCYGVDAKRVEDAIKAWQAAPSDVTGAEIHHAAEPKRQELLRRLNLAPGGSPALVLMREQLLDAISDHHYLRVVDADFVHLFLSWFNRGFLVPRRIASAAKMNAKKASRSRRTG